MITIEVGVEVVNQKEGPLALPLLEKGRKSLYNREKGCLPKAGGTEDPKVPLIAEEADTIEMGTPEAFLQTHLLIDRRGTPQRRTVKLKGYSSPFEL